MIKIKIKNRDKNKEFKPMRVKVAKIDLYKEVLRIILNKK